MPDLVSFEIRKYSVLKGDGTWFHYPQRTGISITFFQFTDDNSLSIYIAHKATELGRYLFSLNEADSLSIIAQSSAIAFKHSDTTAQSTIRFQISFESRSEYNQCIQSIRDQLRLSIKVHDVTVNDVICNQLLPVPGDAGKLNYSASYPTQPYGPVYGSQQMQLPHAIESTYSQFPSVYSPFQYPMLSTQTPYVDQLDLSGNHCFPKQNNPETMVHNPGPIVGGLATKATTSEKMTQEVVGPNFDYSKIVDMSDSTLKWLIETELQKSEFIKLVKKLDHIIENAKD